MATLSHLQGRCSRPRHSSVEALECSERPCDAFQTAKPGASLSNGDDGLRISSSLSSDKFDALILAAAGVLLAAWSSPSQTGGLSPWPALSCAQHLPAKCWRFHCRQASEACLGLAQAAKSQLCEACCACRRQAGPTPQCLSGRARGERECRQPGQPRPGADTVWMHFAGPSLCANVVQAACTREDLRLH